MAASYTIETIREITGAAFLQGPFNGTLVEHLLYDSRQLSFPGSGIFFALSGLRHDGHDFLEQVYADGVRHFIVSKVVALDRLPEANVLLVPDTKKALHALAGFHRRQFNPLLVGITGSNGKTIVKEWLFQLLQEDYAVMRSPRSFNSQVGVPVSVWQLSEEHQVALIEAGISKMGEMTALAEIIRPKAGIFTNLGEAHQAGFPSDEVKLGEKLRLFETADWIIYNADDERVATAIQSLGKHSFTWARTREADLSVRACRQLGWRTLVEASFRGKEIVLTVPFVDRASVDNAIHCWAFLLYLGLPQERIASRMENLKPVAMRLEMKAGTNGCRIINDAYNFDITSLHLALHFLEQHAEGLNRTIIISDMLQGGGEPEAIYSRIAALLAEHQISRVIGVGAEIQRLHRFLSAETRQHFYPDTEALLRDIPAISFDREIILIKGARSFGLERVAENLSRQAHQTMLEINLNALAHNLRVYQQLLRPETRTMVMVKAAAYGTGSREVARLLEFDRVDYLCVAYGDEGVELRQAGVQTPILVLNPEPASFDQLIRYRLEPKVYSLEQINALVAYTSQQGVAVPVHISIDTGMHRLGFDRHELAELFDFLRRHPQVEVKSVFSHLAASEDPAHDAFTQEQYRRFCAAYAQMVEVLGYRPLRHLLNSNGISRFPQYQMDMVRLGIGLYGMDASQVVQRKLQVVLTLRATISQVKDVSVGESIGYGRRARVEKPMRIATISIGYADGLPRKAGNGRFAVRINGQLAPILGSVCMDMCMVDVTEIPDARAGDTVFIFGENPNVELLAEAAETIPYEIFTGVSPRVKRVYVQQ